MSDKPNLTKTEENELDAVIDIMSTNFIESNPNLVGVIMISFLTTFLSGSTEQLQPTVVSTLVTGAHAYRKMLIESGVDVVALEKNFKPIKIK